MALKNYQQRVIEEVSSFLTKLAEQEGRYASEEAWRAIKRIGQYHRRENGLGQDMPHFCLKVPTGGGKTLLATQVLGLIYDTILSARNGAGLALWVVPSDQIYKDTLRALKDRTHFYRESLEFTLRRPVEVWQKEEIARITPAQLQTRLNILMIKQQSVNVRNKDLRKIFEDAGGNVMMHFPPEDDADAHRALLEQFPNLDRIEGTEIARTSVANLIRMQRPPVVLDEGHKHYSPLAQETLAGLNPSIIVELSATPKITKGTGAQPEIHPNILSAVSGKELLDEEMIKLPINIATTEVGGWQECLARACKKRDELEELTNGIYEEGRAIRPIVLVQVQRTGQDQRGSNHIHSEDVKEWLIKNHGIPERYIAIKSSQKDDIEGIDLLDEGCEIRYIITKAALQEGWDCPYAYILVSLNNTQSKVAITQLLGRVLRQPYQTKLTEQDLNESWVFCLHNEPAKLLSQVHAQLKNEGLGDAVSLVRQAGDEPRVREVRMKAEFAYKYKDFEGNLYIPRFCVTDGKEWSRLDYYTHLLAKVNPREWDFSAVDWNLSGDLAKAKQTWYKATLDKELAEWEQRDEEVGYETDEAVANWLMRNLGLAHFDFREHRLIVESCLERVASKNPELAGNLGLVKFPLQKRIQEFCEGKTHAETRGSFVAMFESGRIRFYLECQKCRWPLPEVVKVRLTGRAMHTDTADLFQNNLYDFEDESQFNSYEQKVAVWLDDHPEILWWYRNMTGKNAFAIDGWLPKRPEPDFIAARGDATYPEFVFVIESKGPHLAGSEDTQYKRDLMGYLNQAGEKISWKDLGQDFVNHTFRFQVIDEGAYEQNWKDELRAMIDS